MMQKQHSAGRSFAAKAWHVGRADLLLAVGF
jgi:hypothetical protein